MSLPTHHADRHPPRRGRRTRRNDPRHPAILLLGMCLLGVSLVAAASATFAAADFTLPDTRGKAHKLSDYRGRWVVVNFWATWCGPCREEIPGLVDFHNRHKDRDAVVLGINYEEADPQQIKAFIERYAISYPVLMGTPALERTLGPIFAMPTTFLIRPDGEIAAQQYGVVSVEAIEAFIGRESGDGPVDENRSGPQPSDTEIQSQ